jgi:hypothetical protein
MSQTFPTPAVTCLQSEPEGRLLSAAREPAPTLLWFATATNLHSGAGQADLTEAQTVIAQDAGFGSGSALTRAVATGARPITPYEIDSAESRISPRRVPSDMEWHELIAVRPDTTPLGGRQSG